MPETIAVLNAGGAQSHAIARRLEGAGYTVRRLSRQDGPGLTQVDTESESSLQRALEGAAGAVLTLHQDYRPGAREAYVTRVVLAAEAAGVGRIVLNTAGAVYEDSDLPVAVDLRKLRSIVQDGAVPVVTLQPTVYLDNLLAPWAVPAIVNDGVLAYPAPTNAAVSWLSHDSLAAFVTAAFKKAVAGRTFEIGGPEPLTGAELAAVVGATIGQLVTYQALPLDGFAAGLNAAFGAPAGDIIAGLYRHLEDHPRAVTRDPGAWAELGVQPERAEAWAARQTWAA